MRTQATATHCVLPEFLLPERRAMEFAEDDRDILVKFVKISQARQYRGEHGNWAEYLRFREGLNTMTDPDRRTVEFIGDFVRTFTDKRVTKVIKRLKNWKARRIERSRIKDYLGTSPVEDLLRLTYENPRFEKAYNFPSYHEDWLLTKFKEPESSKIGNNIIAVRCIKVLCKDGSEEVERVCAVNQNMEILLDVFVEPTKPVADNIINANGIKTNGVYRETCSLQDVQKILRKMLKHATIISGHHLNHDLRGLKIDHPLIIDTALIFEDQIKQISKNPTLKGLYVAVTNSDSKSVSKQLASLDGAAKCIMELVKRKMGHKIDSSIHVGKTDVGKDDSSKLFIDKIPPGISLDDIEELFPGYFINVEEFSEGEEFNSTSVRFKTNEHANKAFEMLTGEPEKDYLGRLQKCVALTALMNEGLPPVTVVVRKMVSLEEELEVSATVGQKIGLEEKLEVSATVGQKRKCVEDNSGNNKRRKISSADIIKEVGHSHSCSCIHLKEQDELREQLKRKDEEIMRWRIIVAELTKQLSSERYNA